jgi:hypothetical protein
MSVVVVTVVEKYELVDVKLTFQISRFKCQQQQNVNNTKQKKSSNLIYAPCMTFRFLKKVKMKLQFYTEIFIYNIPRDRYIAGSFFE